MGVCNCGRCNSDGVTYKAQRPAFLEQLRDANVRRAPDFHAGGLMDWSPAERGNELAGETGELCNELKKLLRFDKRHGVKIHSRGGMVTFNGETAPAAGWDVVEERNAIIDRARKELGDVLICLDLVAAVLCIDIEDATRAKFNATSEKIGSGVVL